MKFLHVSKFKVVRHNYARIVSKKHLFKNGLSDN